MIRGEEQKIPLGILISLSAVLLSQISLPFLLSWTSLRSLFDSTIYWNCWALLLTGIFLFIFRFQELHWNSSRRRNLIVSLVFALGVSSMSLLIPPRLRTLADEAILLSTGKAFSETHRSEIATELFPRGEGFQTLMRMVDKRPPGYPFLLSFFNSVRGYAIENTYLLNAVLEFLCLSCLCFLLAENFGLPRAVSGVFLFAAQPQFLYVARSGGMDLLNLLCVLCTVLALQAFLKRPNRGRLEILSYFLLTILFTRYESAVAAGVIGVGLLWKRYLNRETLKNWWYFLLLSLLPLGIIVQRAVATSMEQEEGVSAFAWYYLVMNNIHVLQQSLRFDSDYNVLAPLVMFPALCGALLLLRRQWKNWTLFRLLLVLSFLGMWLVITTLYAGVLNNGISSRYFLLYLLLSALAAAWFFEFLLSSLSLEKGKYLAPVLSATVFLLSLPASIQMNSHYALTSERSVEFVNAIIEQKKLSPLLYISEIPVLFTIEEKGSISFAALRSGAAHVKELLKSEAASGKTVLVLQYLFEETQRPLPGHEVPGDFQLDSLAEFAEHGRLIRLSRLLLPSGS